MAALALPFLQIDGLLGSRSFFPHPIDSRYLFATIPLAYIDKFVVLNNEAAWGEADTN